MRLFFLYTLLIMPTLFAEPHFACCSRTPKYIIAASTALGAGAGALAGYAARNACCCDHKNRCGFGNKHRCGCHQKGCDCNGKGDGYFPDDCFCSEILNILRLIPPDDNSSTGPLVTVSLYSPDNELEQKVVIGRGILPELCDLGGHGHPTRVGKWTVSFTITADGTCDSNFGGIIVEGLNFFTLFSFQPRVGEQQQIVFHYPIDFCKNKPFLFGKEDQFDERQELFAQ